MTEQQFKDRTRKFALNIIRFVSTLERSPVADHIGRQLLPSGTSVGANYRAACRARSAADMMSRLGIVVEEADEASYWLDLLRSSGYETTRELDVLELEAQELLTMSVSSILTIKTRAAKRANAGR